MVLRKAVIRSIYFGLALSTLAVYGACDSKEEEASAEKANASADDEEGPPRLEEIPLGPSAIQLYNTLVASDRAQAAGLVDLSSRVFLGTPAKIEKRPGEDLDRAHQEWLGRFCASQGGACRAASPDLMALKVQRILFDRLAAAADAQGQAPMAKTFRDWSERLKLWVNLDYRLDLPWADEPIGPLGVSIAMVIRDGDAIVSASGSEVRRLTLSRRAAGPAFMPDNSEIVGYLGMVRSNDFFAALGTSAPNGYQNIDPAPSSNDPLEFGSTPTIGVLAETPVGPFLDAIDILRAKGVEQIGFLVRSRGESELGQLPIGLIPPEKGPTHRVEVKGDRVNWLELENGQHEATVSFSYASIRNLGLRAAESAEEGLRLELRVDPGVRGQQLSDALAALQEVCVEEARAGCRALVVWIAPRPAR